MGQLDALQIFEADLAEALEKERDIGSVFPVVQLQGQKSAADGEFFP